MKYYKRHRIPRGFVFLNDKSTKVLQDKTRATQDYLVAADYIRVMPPALDYPETFELYDKAGFFSTVDQNGDRLALRSDVTVQVIKSFAHQLEVEAASNEVHRFYYTVPVFRNLKREYPPLREVIQSGAEIIGEKSELAIIELIELASEVFQGALGKDLHVVVSDVRINKALRKLITNKNQQIDFEQYVLFKNAPELAKLLESCGWTKEASLKLSREFLFPNPKGDLVKEIVSLIQGHHDKVKIQELSNTFLSCAKSLQMIVEKCAIPSKNIHWEPMLTRKTQYYSSFIFEGYIPDVSYPPLRGGSYDNLLREYSDYDLPASGFALDMNAFI